MIRKGPDCTPGLNPHAGDEGVIGNEEVEIILPAIEEAKKKVFCQWPFSRLIVSGYP
ncbi:MAG: 4-hydroxythreonine-4-phosphate dehydrogenase PdxA [Saprospiraceae bacterium]|nr:4-hydroxythreonine-4-phosphate dehydrogenase PdxA [Saprospiraceae bacterium]